MDRKKYDLLIIKRIEKSVNLLIPIAAVIAIISAVLVSISGERNMFVIIDTAIGVAFILLYIFKGSISIKVKIVLLALITTGLGTVSIFQSGFSGTGIILIALSNLVYVSFLSRKAGVIYTALSLGILAMPSFLISLNLFAFKGYNAFLNNEPTEWLLHIVAYLMYGIVLIIIIDAIKAYLIESIDDSQKNAERLLQLAYYDQLTGLPNKFMFIQHLDGIMPTEGWISLLSIRGLNLINSIYGSDVGDRVIKHIGHQLVKSAKEGEFVAKTGGNEFVWYSKTVDPEVILNRILLLTESIYNSHTDADIPTKLNFNTGYANIEGDYVSITKIMQKASLALEQSKSSKSSSITRYDQRLEDQFRNEEKMRRLLLKAIENNEFYISYQEKRDCIVGRVIGLEALARWDSPELGSVSPADFVPVIEKSNLSISFGNMIVRRVLDEYEVLSKNYKELVTVSINISPIHLSSDEFSGFIIRETLNRGIKPEQVVLEITEDSLIEDFEGVSETLYTLRKVGYKISLDDFGTGYSSLSYLARLGFDELKIDKSFIQRLGLDDRTGNLIRAIINLKDTYGISIVAEGVETENQSKTLLDLGCSVHQGFLFSRPTPLSRH